MIEIKKERIRVCGHNTCVIRNVERLIWTETDSVGRARNHNIVEIVSELNAK